jgi:hypothetical protein
MKKRLIIFFFFIFISTFSILAQTDLEKEFLSEIITIDQDVIDAKKQGISIKPILKRYKKLSKKAKNDNQLGAIINTKIGQALTKKHYEKEASKFLIKAYQYRKAQGDFFPQRWALKALINNGLGREDFKFAFKYMKIWIDHTKTNPEKLKEVYKYTSSKENSVSAETKYFIDRLQPLNQFKKYDIENSYLQKGRKYVPKLLKYCYKKLPNYEASISRKAQGFYGLFIQILVESDYDEFSFKIKNESIGLFKKNAAPENYAAYLKYIATWYRKSGKETTRFKSGYTFIYDTYGTKTTKHEAIGIELIKEYIRINKKIAKNKEVLFGYRYIATRYIILEDYQKAVQYLATAIKYCHEYELEEDVVKSIGGLHQMLSVIAKKENKSGLNAAKKWKDGYSLKGLIEDDIQRIDGILK